jgi:hypothetical protein
LFFFASNGGNDAESTKHPGSEVSPRTTELILSWSISFSGPGQSSFSKKMRSMGLFLLQSLAKISRYDCVSEGSLYQEKFCHIFHTCFCDIYQHDFETTAVLCVEFTEITVKESVRIEIVLAL